MTPSSAGSRNGLITWAVIATILGLGCLIWAVVSYTQASTAQDTLRTMQAQYSEIASRQDLQGATVTALRDVKTDPARGYSTMPLLEIARAQTTKLATLVGGAGVTSDHDATLAATAALEAAKTAAGADAAIATDSLVAAIRSLTGHITTQKANAERLNADLTAANQARDAALLERAAVVAATDEKVAAAVKAATEAQENASAYAKTQDTQLATAQGQTTQAREEATRLGEEANGRIAELQQTITQQKRELDEVRGQLARYRVPTNQIVQQADGVITRTPGNDRVFINLGRGDQIAPGLTFEVYDKLGVPTVSNEDAAQDKLLKGKASIEVINVQNGISECRVVRTSPGATITEGDPIVNVVYDKKVKFNFFVYGKFNLDYRGEATERDTDITRRLISGWGGVVTDQLNTKTDFVVLGEEPVVPAYTQEELAREPEKAFQKEQAEQALEQFTDTRAKANQLNIPILNQTRFLYMIGYYEEAGR